MRKRIKLRTHDGSGNYLVYKEYANPYYVFTLKTEMDVYRISSDKDGNAISVDPIGGPMMALGDNTIIPGMVLRKIVFANKEALLYFKSVTHAESSSKRLNGMA